MPLLSRFEKVSELPSSISAAVYPKNLIKMLMKVMQSKLYRIILL